MRKLPLFVSLMLLVMAVMSSVSSYDRTRQCIDEELDHALSLTIQAKGFERMKQDSIRAYRLLATPSSEHKMLTIEDPVFQRHIRTEALRSKAFIAYHITPADGLFDVKMEGQRRHRNRLGCFLSEREQQRKKGCDTEQKRKALIGQSPHKRH